jgi:glutaryl-CoA dehydrogenase
MTAATLPRPRHWADMEAVYTYEGTDGTNSLVVGREIAGLRAFT